MKAFLVFKRLGDLTGTVVEADHFAIQHGVLIFYKQPNTAAAHSSNQNQSVEPILAVNGLNWARVESVEDLKETHQKYAQITGGEKRQNFSSTESSQGVQHG